MCACFYFGGAEQVAARMWVCGSAEGEGELAL